jgi:hypothetical protein
MKPLSRMLALMLCLLVLAQSAWSDTVCGSSPGGHAGMGMPTHHQMDGHSTPTRAPQQHPCGPMSGALCQVMSGCLDLGAPLVAIRVARLPVTHASPQAVTPLRVPLRDLAPPLTPPRA